STACSTFCARGATVASILTSDFQVAGLIADREIHRSRDETKVVHLVVQGVRLGEMGAAVYTDPRSQDRSQEAALAARSGLADAYRSILVSPYHNPGVARQVQVPEHVAG